MCPHSAPEPSIQDQYSDEKTYKYGSSAYYAYLFLAQDTQKDIKLLHAFFHEISNVLYISTESSVARLKLSWWKNEIEQLFHGKPEHPISQALVATIKKYDLKKQYFDYIVESVEMDLSHNRYLDWTSLKNFCTMQSGAFACLITQVLAPTNEQNIRFAQKLGVAIHFTHLLRGLGQDATQGRIYIPMDFLREHQIKAADILNAKYSDEFRVFMQAQGNYARQLFKEALPYLAPESRQALRPCLIKANLCLKLLKALEKDQWRVLDKGISLSPVSKLLTASKVWLSQGRYFGM
ncbi:squalene/phytoene synthase family protein [Pelistega sp. MC2]|uniref:squalene/phytoene synthase family protein n=1 Tax=Pelistega sp. MC2 TaxID=1720297 RepID=UPI0008D9893E|nr:squalene/phytoene synthase family protein [Pelistega sp. MC2]